VSQERKDPDRPASPPRYAGLRRRSTATPGVLARRGTLRRSLADGPGTGRSLDRDATYRRLLAVADVGSAALATICCGAAFAGAGPLTGLLAGGPLMLVVAKLMGLYDRDEVVMAKSTLDELPALFQLAAFYTLIVWLLNPEPRGEMVALWALLFVFLALSRWGARRVARRITPPERCLFVGSEPAYRWLTAKLGGATRVNAELVGSIPLGASPIESLQQELRTQRVDRVILALRGEVEADSTLELLTHIKSSGCKVSLMPRMLEVVGSSVEFDDIDGVTMLGVRRFGLTRSSLAVKRALDVAASAVLLLAVAPLMGLVALLVRVDSPGRALFRQKRVGRDGQPFEMLKFRSMSLDAEARHEGLLHLNEARGLFKIANDPRVTRVGRGLRNTSLDELPQLLNVLKGDMSLVGPRPLVVEDDRRIQGWHRRRLHLKPGMTGPWQILGSSRIPLEEMVTIDYLYVANWTLWVDVKILLRTVAHVVHRRGC
jgi:exopolysaccharide biosynthesis polyprenyl glycosylphosphotransferase